MYHLRESIWKAAKQVHLSSFSLPEFSSRTSASAQGTWKSFMCNFWRKCIIPCIYESIRCIHEQNRCGRIPLKGKFLKKKNQFNKTHELLQWQAKAVTVSVGISHWYWMCVKHIPRHSFIAEVYMHSQGESHRPALYSKHTNARWDCWSQNANSVQSKNLPHFQMSSY